LDNSGSSDSAKTVRDDIDIHPGRKETPRAAVFRKEVLMPAWQFFHLIRKCLDKYVHKLLILNLAWFAPRSEGRVSSDAQVAAHFATKKPMLGICLKRYSVSLKGVTKRLNTLIDIPLEIRLPHFMQDGTEDDGWGSSFSRFKLSLQSVICHRGASIEAGHYVTLVRPFSNEPAPTDELKDVDPKFRWILFDDLARDNRVRYVDVRKSLKDEVPYLVFYQVQPVDEFGELTGEEVPPSYEEATHYPSSTNTLAANEGTSSQNLNGSISTILGTSLTSSPAATKTSSPLIQPSKLGHIVIPPMSEDPSLASLASSKAPDSKTPSLAAISQTSSQILGSDGIAVQDTLALSHAYTTLSCPPEMNNTKVEEETTVRPHSFDIQGRKSHDSDPNKRLSVTFTDSTAPSAPITPYDDASNPRNNSHDGDYLAAKEINGATSSSAVSTPAAINSSKRGSGSSKDESRWRGRVKDKDGEDTKAGRRHSSRNWLSVTGSVRPRVRPVSQPPIGENRRSIMGGDLFKGLRDAMSRDKLNADNSDSGASATAASSSQQTSTAAMATNTVTNGNDAATTATNGEKSKADEKGPNKEKEKTAVGRRKSLKHNLKGKARKDEGPNGITPAAGDTPDRQCRVM
jgi:ubiquitin carboxyl-terminal hydrolase